MIYSKDIDLNMYKTFYAVATSGSFLKASELLYVSQPAISMSIKKLEEQLDVKLFKRNNKGIQLTEHGKQLLFYVETMFNTINTAEKRLKEDKNLNNGEVRIGVPTHIGIFLVNDLIEGFKELYPGVKFHIENRSTQEMVNMLTKREIDIIIDSAPISTTLEDMEIINLMEFENCFVANKKYEKLSKETLSFSELNKYQLLLPAERTSSRINLEKEVSKEKKDLKLKPIIEVSTTEVMYDLAFTLLCLTLVGFIVIIIFLNINGASRMIYNIGKIICLAIIGAGALAFIFYLVDFIILCKDYADFSVSGRYWAAAIIPSLLAFAAIIVMALIANRLVKEFSDRMNSATAYPNAVPQTTMTTNIPQPSLFPNNNGPNPPVGNYQSRAVVVQQGENNA